MGGPTELARGFASHEFGRDATGEFHQCIFVGAYDILNRISAYRNEFVHHKEPRQRFFPNRHQRPSHTNAQPAIALENQVVYVQPDLIVDHEGCL